MKRRLTRRSEHSEHPVLCRRDEGCSYCTRHGECYFDMRVKNHPAHLKALADKFNERRL